MKIVTVVGARPQFVKAAVVSRAIDEHNARAGGPAMQELLVHTGQHYDQNMSEVFFREMGMRTPAYHLGVSGGTHGQMTARMLEALERVLLDERPDAVLIYGDTNSTLAGALAAAKLHVPIAHVEAGLRSFNMRMPEEVNRVVADRLAHWLFCPTAGSEANLRAEGALPAAIHRAGDVMYDAALFYGAAAVPSGATRNLLDALGGPFCLSTIHRAESTDDVAQLAEVCSALEAIAAERPVLLPLHPRTRARLEASSIAWKAVRVIEPVSYFDMIALLRACSVVLTDSGGVQKEAFFFGKPCLTLRNETEWVELVDLGVNVLAGVRRDSILESWRSIQRRSFDFSARPYGNGEAGKAIVEVLASGPRRGADARPR